MVSIADEIKDNKLEMAIGTIGGTQQTFFILLQTVNYWSKGKNSTSFAKFYVSKPLTKEPSQTISSFENLLHHVEVPLWKTFCQFHLCFSYYQLSFLIHCSFNREHLSSVSFLHPLYYNEAIHFAEKPLDGVNQSSIQDLVEIRCWSRSQTKKFNSLFW